MVPVGIRIVLIAIALGFGIAATADIYFQLRRWRSVSTRLQVWARRYPLYSALLVFLLGALLAHFFINTD
jgi:hypothetical protein